MLAAAGRSCRVIAIANQKGGVGKTTTAVNLSAGLCQKGVKTLLIDFDPQGNATSGYGVEKRGGSSIYDVIAENCVPEKAVVTTKFGDIIPSQIELAGAEIALVGRDDREHSLKNAVNSVKNEYDVVIIDSPPSLGLLTLNALCAADAVLITLQCEYFALEGLSMLIDTIKNVRKKLNRELEIDGILFTMFDGRTNLSSQVVREVKKYFSDKIYKSVITRSVRLSEAPSHGKPIQYYEKNGRGAENYNSLVDEFMKRNHLRAK